MNITCTASLYERFKYGFLSIQEVEDALKELAEWQDLDLGTPKEVETLIDDLQEKQCTNHEDYSELKEFFDDCVQALNSHWPWPAADAYDQNLRQVICSAITRGDVEEEEEP